LLSISRRITRIYGGGYTGGYKNSNNPSGIIRRSQNNGANGVIFVDLNYRLGALGWLAGPTLQAAGGVSNAGLYDQRLALEWVQKYIHLFGGDPDRVTVMGESAGGGSIMHQITAYGGQKPVPFAQAIPQSPGWLSNPSNFVQENNTQNFLALLNVTSIEAARKLSSEAVIAANAQQVGASHYGQYTYGPVVDGSFVPALPSLLLNQGTFAKNVKVMVGHNADEGPLFTPPFVTNDTALIAYLLQSYPTMETSIAQYIVKTLYPAVYDGTYPYTSGLQRTIFIVSESIFTCNTNYLDRAYGNQTYAYEFSVPPAEHGFDVAYTFYNGVAGSEMVIDKVARAMQQYITDFVQTGAPNGNGVPQFNMYGTSANEQNLNVTGFMPMRDPTANARCMWWQKALYY
jgi:carboxylesterase type B